MDIVSSLVPGSLYHGLRPISVYVELLGLVYYTFSFLGWRTFQGDFSDSACNFDTMGWRETLYMCVFEKCVCAGDSMLTMFQVQERAC